MLEIVKYNQDEYEFPALLVLGCFDGVHIGHLALLKNAKLQAKINGLDLGIMVFSEGKGGRQLYTFEERLKIFEQFNAKFVLLIDFNDEFKKTAASDFLAAIEEKINVKAYMSGKDFRFGAGAKGKSATLKKYAEDDENGVWYTAIKEIAADGEKVSCSHIKELLASGELEKANELLGRNYSVSGEVLAGEGRGKQLTGFPTINIHYPEIKAELKKGVYKIKITIDEATYLGVANWGARPTFDDENAVIEGYIDGFEGNLYGSTVTVEFVKYLRETAKFETAEQLTEQIKADIQSIKEENND